MVGRIAIRPYEMWHLMRKSYLKPFWQLSPRPNRILFFIVRKQNSFADLRGIER
jgi:hypothetical protein